MNLTAAEDAVNIKLSIQHHLSHSSVHSFVVICIPPECKACQSALTVKHILIDCTHLSAVRQRYFRVDTPK